MVDTITQKEIDDFMDQISGITSNKEKSVATRVIEKIDKWSMKHPGLSLLIFFGGGSFLAYKISQSFVAGAVFKGNIKTLRYMERFVK